MHHMYLERHDAENNLHRFYQLFITPGLFDDWSLLIRPHEVLSGIFHRLVLKETSNPIRGLF